MDPSAHADGWSSDLLPDGLSARHVRLLPGGFASPVWLCDLEDGERVVVKASAVDRHELFTIEAEGLAALARLGLRTPRVLAVGSRSLTLEALNPDSPDDDTFWRATGRAVAHLHATSRHDRFGWHRDGWLGLSPQRNAWDADGHRFFATNRVLRYLGEPRVEAALDPGDRTGIERLCTRLPSLIPDTGACLTHGDMWRNNVIADRGGQPAFVDPAVSYCWAEVDVAHMLCSGGIPPAFFAAYDEIRPLHRDWREHARILNLRQLLAMLAAGVPVPGIVGSIRDVVGAFR